jgi:hypothetical protein
MNPSFKIKGFIYEVNWIVEKIDEKSLDNLLTHALWLHMALRTRPTVKRFSGYSGSINGSCVYELAAAIGKDVFHGLLHGSPSAISI